MFILKCRLQTLYILFAFTLGVFLTISIQKMDNCRDQQQDYFNLDLKHDQFSRKVKRGDYDLVILVISSPRNGDRRQMIRETWLQFIDKLKYEIDSHTFRISYYFVIGNGQLTTDTILHLSTEQSVNNDLLFVDVDDKYESLTEKVLKTFQWLHWQNSKSNINFDYVLKCDDDSFVRLDLLALELTKLTENVLIKSGDDLIGEQKRELYWGYFNGHARVKTQGKWKEQDWFLCDYYLPYALGGGYILSRQLANFIGQNANYFTCYKAEDVSVGVWLSAVKNVYRKHDTRFDTEWQSRGCQNEYLITHKHTIETMRLMYKQIQTTGQLCQREYVTRPHYEYNWHAPPSKCCDSSSSKNN